jgi:quercetin dioxygenase-like cupin family protein
MSKENTRWADPSKVASNVYNMVLENDRVRVFDVRFKPGAKAVMHGHPEHVVYILNDGKLKLAFPDGSEQEIPIKAGQALFMPAGPHETTNVGATEVRNLVVELK